MMLMTLLTIGLCALRHSGVEARLRLYFEDLQILKVDPAYLDPKETEGHIDEDESGGENAISTTLKILQDLPADAEGHLSLMGLSMGKYTVPTGVDFNMGVCEMLDEPIMMGPFYAILGFSKTSCPPKAGLYSQDGYKVPTESLPEEFPENKYEVYIAIKIKGKPILAVKLHADVQYD